MKFTPTKLSGVLIIQPRVFEDERGFFLEEYRKDIFAQNGIEVDFVQDNHALSKKGSLRGLHYQAAPKAQAKLVRVMRGKVFDVVVDVRPGSKTFGQHVTQVLDADAKTILFVPAGFAHGYLTLSDEAEFLYKTSDFYSPAHERGIRWDDPGIRIDWPKLDRPYTLSAKDKALPSLQESLR